MGLQIPVHVWEKLDRIFFFFFQTEYSTFEMSLNIRVVTMLMFPGVTFLHWSQHIAGAYNGLLGMQTILKKYCSGNFYFPVPQ